MPHLDAQADFARARLHGQLARVAGWQLLRSDALGLELEARDVIGMAQAAEVVTRLSAAADSPTAIFTAQNLITIGTIHSLRASGRQDAIAVVGFDDFLLADLLEPAVTVVAQDPSELGSRAARRLFARIDGDRSPLRREVCGPI